MKTILGLDLGTNSIGWALIDAENKKILGLGSRIIPMTQDVLDNFGSGKPTNSQTAERTRHRGVRRLYQRDLLRRERLHIVLNILGFLPKHYADSIDFVTHFGQFKPKTETKIVYQPDENGKYQFLFQSSFNEMLSEFKANGLGETKIPYDWTIYYLRKKALTQKIEKEELAWLLLHFNQKRGYYQMRNKDNEEKRSFRSPKEGDWGLVKVRTEQTIYQSGKTVGAFIYDALLENPSQKINGKLVRTIERKFYKDELKQILTTQMEFHKELQDSDLYLKSINELYKQNEAHKRNIKSRGFDYLFLDDIIFYQRPLKSKVSLISNCKLEFRYFKNEDGNKEKQPLKCIAKSHPLFQEFRLWQFVKNLKVIQREKILDNETKFEVDVTNEYIKSEEDCVALFEQLNDKKEITQKLFLAIYKLKENKYRWNFVEDKTYPCNQTRGQFLLRAEKIEGRDANFFNEKNTEDLWHILYSVSDKIEIEKALTKFATHHHLPEEFVKIFSNFPPYENDYGSVSAKAIKKLLPLMRMGKYWNAENIDAQTTEKIEKLITGEWDEKIKDRVREKAIDLTQITQ